MPASSDAMVAEASDESLRALHARALELANVKAGQRGEAYMQRMETYLDAEAQLCGKDLVIGVLHSLHSKINRFARLGKMTEAQVRSLAADRLSVAQAYLDRDALLARALNRSML